MEDKKLSIFRTTFDNLTRSEACDKIEEFIANKDKMYLVAVKDVALTVRTLENPWLLDFYNSADLLVVDGRGLVYASYLLSFGKNGFKEMVGAPGIYFEMLKRATQKGYSLYYFGATPDGLEQAIHNVQTRLPGLKICGSHSGYLNDSQDAEHFLRSVNESRPDLVFVGISSPVRETIIEKYRHRLPNCVFFFVGGIFDVETGKVSLAPSFVSYLGLEWLWRVIQEPRRLAGRYIRTHSKFVVYLLKEWLGR